VVSDAAGDSKMQPGWRQQIALPRLGVICYFKKLLHSFNHRTNPMKKPQFIDLMQFFYNKLLTYCMVNWKKLLLETSEHKHH
jgi:hypothetical protein